MVGSSGSNVNSGSNGRRGIAVLAISAISAVFAITAVTYGVHRYLVGSAIEAAAPQIAQRDSARKAEQAATDNMNKMRGHRDTLTMLLKNIEQALVERPTDSMLVIKAANIAYDLQEYETAEKYYRIFLKDIDKTNIPARIDLAYVVFSSGKHDEGISSLKDVLKSDPKNQMAMYNLAFMFDNLGNKDEAKAWITKCRDVDPNSALGQQSSRILESLH